MYGRSNDNMTYFGGSIALFYPGISKAKNWRYFEY